MVSGNQDFQTVVVLRGMYSGSDIALAVDATGRLRVARINISDLAGDHGDLDGLDANDHAQYLLRDLTQALTGTTLYKSVSTSLLRLIGGTNENGQGADLWLYGASHASYPGRAALYVPNSTKTAGICMLLIDGTTDTPVCDFQAKRLTNLADPTGDQDAATKTYVDDHGFSMDSRIVFMWRGNIADLPDGAALCDGTNGLPDMRDKFVVGAGSTYNPADTGGQATHQLTVDEMPNHDHDYYTREIGQWGAGGTTHYVFGGTILSSTLTVGGGNAHENRPPYFAVAYFCYL